MSSPPEKGSPASDDENGAKALEKLPKDYQQSGEEQLVFEFWKQTRGGREK
jgi:hypothetical protein